MDHKFQKKSFFKLIEKTLEPNRQEEKRKENEEEDENISNLVTSGWSHGPLNRGRNPKLSGKQLVGAATANDVKILQETGVLSNLLKVQFQPVNYQTRIANVYCV